MGRGSGGGLTIQATLFHFSFLFRWKMIPVQFISFFMTNGLSRVISSILLPAWGRGNGEGRGVSRRCDGRGVHEKNHIPTL